MLVERDRNNIHDGNRQRVLAAMLRDVDANNLDEVDPAQMKHSGEQAGPVEVEPAARRESDFYFYPELPSSDVNENGSEEHDSSSREMNFYPPRRHPFPQTTTTDAALARAAAILDATAPQCSVDEDRGTSESTRVDRVGTYYRVKDLERSPRSLNFDSVFNTPSVAIKESSMPAGGREKTAARHDRSRSKSKRKRFFSEEGY